MILEKNKSGITLIALIITVIILLVLAGISLNAIIGENSVITQAQNADMKSGMVALEEYLYEKYIEFYDESDYYPSKVEVLTANMSSLFLKDGTKNYITYNDGNGAKQYYLINKSNLPQDIQEGLKAGDSDEFAEYSRLIDVYGVTPDLKVYYCNYEDIEHPYVFGEIGYNTIDPNTILAKIKSNNGLNDALTDILGGSGITVGEDGITMGDVAALRNITLDGDVYTSISNLYGISEILGLKELTLKNMELSSLDELEKCPLLNYVFLENCKIANYNALSECISLKTLYLHNPPNNSEVEKLSSGLSNSKLEHLEYFGIFGYLPNLYVSGNDSLATKKVFKTTSDISDISSLNNISNKTKKSIQYLYLNNNKITSIESLSGFSNINLLYLMCNPYLNNLDGLSNHTNLKYLYCQCCTVSDFEIAENYIPATLNSIEGLSGCSNLQELTLNSHPQLTSLSGLEQCKNLRLLYVAECNLTDISSLNNNTVLEECNLQDNYNLRDVRILSTCTALKYLYLKNNENMNVDDIPLLENILLNCISYTIPSKYLMYFSSVKSYDYTVKEEENTNASLTDYSKEIKILKNRTNVEYLRLNGNSELGKSKIGKLIKEDCLEYSDLEIIETNLNLSESERQIISSYKAKGTTAAIKNMTQSQIDAIENVDNDIYFRYLLSTMTGMEALSVDKITNLTSIDFVKNMTGLVQLDLRYTNMTDLSLLENITTLKILAISNSGINMKQIQSTISRLGFVPASDGTAAPINNIVSGKNNYSSKYGSGLLLCGTGFTNSFLNCTDITDFNCYAQGVDAIKGQTINLSGCTSLKRVHSYVVDNTYIFPSSVTYIDLSGCSFNATACTSLKTVRIFQSYRKTLTPTDENLGVKTLVNSPMVTFTAYRVNTSFDILNNFTAAQTTLKNLNIYNDDYGYNISKFRITGNFSDVNKVFSVLENVKIHYNFLSNVLTNINVCCPNVKIIYADNNNISDITSLSGLSNLEELYINDNNISNISSLQNLTKLKVLTLYNNSITNLKPLLGLIVNNTTKLRTLDLHNNILENIPVNDSTVNNVNILVSLNEAGLNDLNISANSFSNINDLKSLSWTSFVY